jgi:transcription elongation factor GreA
MSEEVLLSPEGLAKLKSELENLKGPERQRIAEAILEAKSHGDLRENAMYHEAKLNQKRLEQRIAELEHTLNVAQVVDPTKATGAHLGNKVVLEDLEWGDQMTIELVGGFEADPLADKISITSPLGAAVLNANPGDEVEFDAPAGKKKYRVLAVD